MISKLLSPLRRSLAFLTFALAFAAPAAATWSIVVVDTRTGEVALFSATCVQNIDLERLLGLVRVGEGAAAIQFAGDPTVQKRRFIRDRMEVGMPPAQILAEMQTAFADMNGIQLGITSLAGDAVTWTGSSVWGPNAGIQGEAGDLRYSIQGNVITGDPVVLQAEAALIHTEGDLLTRVLAAMEASRAMGGDGRCSCNDSSPGSCGSPPASFSKTAHVGFLILARMGDAQGDCVSGFGCTNGDYYLQRKVTFGGFGTEDPVLRLFDKVRLWEQGLVGVADQLLSEVDVDRQRLVADGVSKATVTLRLVDRRGDALTTGGQSVTVTPAHSGASPATVQNLVDHGDGTHSFELLSTQAAGEGEWHVRVDDGTHDVLMWPPVTLRTDPALAFHASASEVRVVEGADVVLTVTDAARAGAAYRVLGSLAGTSPGTVLQGIPVPLNPDRLFGITLGATTPRVFSSFAGVLDGTGRAEAMLRLDPALASVFAGSRFDFAAWLTDANGSTVTNTDGFTVVP